MPFFATRVARRARAPNPAACKLRRLRFQGAVGAALAVALLAPLVVGPAPAAPGDPCAPPIENAIACENSKPGHPDEWEVSGSGDPSIQGFATELSVNKGETIRFKIKTNASAYSIDIYRLGFYGGDGARRWATIAPSAALPQSQPDCLGQFQTALVDCGNWAVSASWAVPTNAVSGVYVARLRRPDTGGESHILFIVRDDSGGSDVLFQTSDTTWQAYNSFGGAGLYSGGPLGRALKVSYNRPFNTRDSSNHSYFFSAEYPMVRWLEANGYDVSYFTGIDTARRGSELLEHEVFFSVGHDEYWSGGQRANVEAARDAGVDLGFFSGNEVFWKTRWEPSIDGSGTPYRTLVAYKETHANAKIDPDPAWTGTWRDPRFSPPSDGGRPENALTGTLFTVNGYQEDAITVPAAYKHLRFWRNTSIASLPPGGTATLPLGTLGYEWDEDVQNGWRPAGLLNLSSTTLDVEKKLTDYGSSYAPGTATHKLTLYRAPSGALVFGAGTVQWAWGLDSAHDTISEHEPRPADPRMQQATVNLLADMGAQPGTLQPGLVASAASTDTDAPTAVITSPAVGASVQSGTTVTIGGTASDAGGGAVGVVEISTDGGSTWRPASGGATWSYSWDASGFGQVSIRARAVDDSGNIQSVPTTRTVNVSCPCRLWGNSTTPAMETNGDTRAVELGVKFQAQVDGLVTGIRFYKSSGNTGTHHGSLWTAAGTLLARAVFTGETASGWQSVTFDSPVPVSAGTTYVASYFAPRGGYSVDRDYFSAAGLDRPPLHALRDGLDGGNGVFAYSATPTFPATGYQGSNYWVDVTFTTELQPDTIPPTVVATSPQDGVQNADTRGTVTVTFSEAVNAATVNASTFQLRDGAGNLVSAGVTYNAQNRTAGLTPDAPLAYSSAYSARIRSGAAGVKDLAGNPLAADVTWGFSTQAPGACPCTIWPGSARPEMLSNGDTRAVELGVKFRADSDGYVTALRFYKSSANTGSHVASLWTSTGALVARTTFTGETATGWQQAPLDGPVAIRAERTYVVSYHAPSGGYSFTRDYFGAGSFDNPPLRALGNGIEGVNGLYRYSDAPAFPDSGYLATNYWVDVVFERTPPADTSPPRVTSVVPAAGVTDAPVNTTVRVNFSESMTPSSIDASTVRLLDDGGDQVPATVTYDVDLKMATLVPVEELSYSAAYTAEISGGASGAKDLAGNSLLGDYTWSFTTKTCPCSLWNDSARPLVESNGDTGSVELGIRFRPDTSGFLTGVRFYKSAANTGTHVGSVWSGTGTLLRRATFVGETASGWQTVIFPTPLQVTAGTTYVASYHAPNGGYSYTRDYFTAVYANAPLTAPADSGAAPNGLYRYSSTPAFPDQGIAATNYWVDPVFERTAPPDGTPPQVTSVLPSAGAVGVSVGTVIRATFSEPMNETTIGDTSVELRSGDGSLVPASVTYDPGQNAAILDPLQPLSYSTTYSAVVRGGSSGAKDLAGNPIPSDHTWSFTTKTCPCSLWTDAARPAVESSGDSGSVNLGVRFQPEANGFITGIRFYKGAANTGTHTGSLWTQTGTLLRSVTFVGETASGWQTASFASPVPVTAGTTYIASYHAPNGRYAVTSAYFTGSVLNPPLIAPANLPAAGNGLYLYSATPAFPDRTYGASNYWVDVVYSSAVP
jgi:Domain of unknown function (DUF4082)/Bacterial Ig-like domain/Bacterial Ig domain